MAVFWDTAPCTLADIDRRFRGAYCLHRQGDLIASETSVNIHQATRRNNPEDSHLHSHCRENLKSHLKRELCKFRNVSQLFKTSRFSVLELKGRVLFTTSSLPAGDRNSHSLIPVLISRSCPPTRLARTGVGSVFRARQRGVRNRQDVT
jgi:hypothetical protein